MEIHEFSSCFYPEQLLLVGRARLLLYPDLHHMSKRQKKNKQLVLKHTSVLPGDKHTISLVSTWVYSACLWPQRVRHSRSNNPLQLWNSKRCEHEATGLFSWFSSLFTDPGMFRRPRSTVDWTTTIAHTHVQTRSPPPHKELLHPVLLLLFAHISFDVSHFFPWLCEPLPPSPSTCMHEKHRGGPSSDSLKLRSFTLRFQKQRKHQTVTNLCVDGLHAINYYTPATHWENIIIYPV